MVCHVAESTPSDGIGPWVGKPGLAWDSMGIRPTVIHRLWISLGKMWMGACTSWGWPRKSQESCGGSVERRRVRPVDDADSRPCRPMPDHSIGRGGGKRVPPWGAMGSCAPTGTPDWDELGKEGEKRQMACKPGSVSRPEGQAMAIRLGRRLPGRLARPTRAAARKRA